MDAHICRDQRVSGRAEWRVVAAEFRAREPRRVEGRRTVAALAAVSCQAAVEAWACAPGMVPVQWVNWSRVGVRSLDGGQGLRVFESEPADEFRAILGGLAGV